MNKRVVGTMAAALVLALGAFGCGGGDDEDSPALTKAQFVKQGNSICAKAEGERLAAVKRALDALPPGGRLKPGEEADLVPTVLRPYGDAATELEELGAPEGQEEQVEKITAAMHAALDEAEGDPQAAVKGGGEVFEEANELATKYGLTKCII